MRAPRSALIGFVLLFSSSLFAQGLIFLVRHGEKLSNAPDALLSPAGQQRAQCLAHTLRDAGISSIYVTDRKRTQQTAGPLAKALNLTPAIVPRNTPEQNASAIADKLRREGNHNVLVVGHQETLPLILERLGGAKIRQDQVQYDTMFILAPHGPRRTRPAIVHYCEASASDSMSMQPTPK